MNRSFMALLLMLTLSLQGSVAAFAAVHTVLQPGCGVAAEQVSVSHKSCCLTGGTQAAGCCLDACAGAVSMSLSPATPSISYGRPSLVARVGSNLFSSRGALPLT